MGKQFHTLAAREQKAVADFARFEWEKIASLNPPTYVSANAKADPKGWQERLCELIAADPKRVRSFMERAQTG